MNQDWKQDPRLKRMSSQKISLLNEFSNRIENTPTDQLMTTLLSLNAEVNQRGIQFSNEETELLIAIIRSNMDSGERGRMEMIRMISKNFINRNKKP